MTSLGQVEGNLGSGWARVTRRQTTASLVLVKPIDVHGTLHLLFQLFLHLYLRILLLRWVQDAHGLEVEGTNTSHEGLLQILLHVVLVSVHDGLLSLRVVQLLAEGLDLLLVRGTDGLQLRLDRIVELFFIPADLCLLEVLLPRLEHVSQHLHFAGSISMLQDHSRVLSEFAVLFECAEAPHLDDFHSCEGLSLAGPESHDLASQRVFLGQLALGGELLLELFDLALLGVQQGVAPPALRVDVLLLLIVEAALGFDEFLHGLRSEIKNQLVKSLGEVLIVQCLLHLVHCGEGRHGQRLRGFTLRDGH